MPEPQTIWMHGEPVAVPRGSHVVHLSEARIALVASPVWQVRVLLGEGLLEAPDEATNRALLAQYFSDLTEQESSLPNKILSFPEAPPPSSGMAAN